MYSSTMADWIKISIKPFFDPQELNDKNQMIQKIAMNYLKSQLKGPTDADDFIISFLNRFHQVKTCFPYLLL